MTLLHSRRTISNAPGELGVSCFAITDHHVLDSLPEVLEISQRYPEIRVVPSAELTMTTSIGSVDLLCYGFPAELPPAMKQVLEAYHRWQRDYGAAISSRPEGSGIRVSDEDRLDLLRSYRPEKTIEVQGNTHVKGGVIQQYCVARGFIDRIEDYGDLMSRAGAATRFPPYPHVKDAMPAVKEAGALVAIAHPFGYFREDNVERMDALRTECSLDGIECAHPVCPRRSRRIPGILRRYGLFSTGGSDCHTDEDVERGFAGHGGPDEWLDEFLERLD